MKSVTLYLNKREVEETEKGQHAFFSGIATRFSEIGFKVKLKRLMPFDDIAASTLPGYHLFQTRLTSDPKVLTVRRAGFIPYWTVEAHERRNRFRLSQLSFCPDSVDEKKAHEFTERLRRRIIGKRETKHASGGEANIPEGAIFVALQGALKRNRNGQSMNSVQMIKETVAHAKGRPVVVKLHPGETYSDGDLKTIERLEMKGLFQTTTASIHDVLPKVSLVVSMYSNVVMEAMLYHKPSILFAEAEFAHICTNVKQKSDIAGAFEHVFELNPDYDKYLYWFLEENCINAWSDHAIDRFMSYCAEFGWPVD